MPDNRLRVRIAWEAARMMYGHDESDCFRAKMKAARRLQRGEIRRWDLPSDREVREQLAVLTKMHRHREGHEHHGPPPLPDVDRFETYRVLLLPLEDVRENPRYHPEGDALYHSLQVFELCRERLPYDEELLIAALLHDVGKAIDPKHHVEAALAELAEWITPRTAWLIEHHGEAKQMIDGTLGVRSQRRLSESPSFEELMVLAECDREGRVAGAPTPGLDEALDYLRQLEESNE